jgi:hypothetical protein
MSLVTDGGRGLPQSKTLARHPAVFPGSIFPGKHPQTVVDTPQGWKYNATMKPSLTAKLRSNTC